jgi:hypothetical protein
MSEATCALKPEGVVGTGTLPNALKRPITALSANMFARLNSSAENL